MTVSYLFPSSCVFNINHSNIVKVLYIKDFTKTQLIFFLLQFSGSQTERNMQCPMNKCSKHCVS